LTLNQSCKADVLALHLLPLTLARRRSRLTSDNQQPDYSVRVSVSCVQQRILLASSHKDWLVA